MAASGISSVAVVDGVHLDPEAFVKLGNSDTIVQGLIAAAATITGVAITHSGKFTGALNASMEYTVGEDDQGAAQALLGSGARSGDTVAQAAFNWYAHYNIDKSGAEDQIPVDPNYPEWQTHDGVKTQPSRPYEAALHELDIPFIVNPETADWATQAGPIE